MNRRGTPTTSSASRRTVQAALSAYRRGACDEAEALFQDLARRSPHLPDPWHYWGLLLHQRGERDRALECLQRAHSLDPDNLVFLLNFGRVLREQGQYPRAIACLERAHRLEPDHAQVLVLLAQAMLAVERGGELLPEIERHLGWAGDHWRLWMLLGECREQAGDRPGALVAFAEAARLAPPGETGPHLRRADAARRAHDNDTAIRSLQAALRINGDLAEPRAGFAYLAAEGGDFERAKELAREALALDESLFHLWDLLANLTPRQSLAPLAGELAAAAGKAADDPRAWPLHFARGRILEKLGDYDPAFAAYAEGNRIRTVVRPYSPETQAAHTRDLIDALGPSFAARAEKIGAVESPVIFVCGMPRSGTTLVETVLASHPDVTAGGEQRFIHDRIRRELGAKGATWTGTWLRDLDDRQLAQMAADWHRDLLGKTQGRRFVTDKMPGNYALMGLLHVCFPTAPIVHVRRDPRDNCFSCYALSFAEGHSFSYALNTVGHYYRLYDALATHWNGVLPAGRIIEIGYENLVAEPEDEIRRLLDAVGLDWDPKCLDFHETARNVATASVYQVRQPLYSSSIGRWRHFEKHLGPLLAVLDGPPPV